MRDWKHKVEVVRHVFDFDEETGSVKELGKTIADSLSTLPPRLRRDIEDVVEELPQCEDLESLNFLLRELYDWGDNTDVFLGPLT